MQVNEVYTVKIEKLVNEGKGIARVNDFPVFIENVCPDDIVKIKVDFVKKSYALASVVEIEERSIYRIEPKCPLHNVCGSCNWQFIDYNEQLRQKKNIVYETLHKFADFDCDVQDTIASPLMYEYRCKIQYPVSQTKVSKRIVSGYYKKNSHELINIKYCPLQPDIINEINETVKTAAKDYGVTGYIEKLHTGMLRHIVYRISSDLKNILVIFVINSKTSNTQIEKLANFIFTEFPQIKGVCVNFNDKKTNVILSKETKCIKGDDFYIEELSGKKYKISANSFFQVNPLCAEKIFDTVKQVIAERIENPKILDAYSGVSSFGIWLADIASTVVSVEESVSASNDALKNVELNNVKNLVVKNGDAAVEFAKLIQNGETFDVSVTDPPRKGCSEESIANLIKLTSKFIVYVSCNVATLARDMKTLIRHGFKPVFIQPVDMFPHTYHVETIVLFEKSEFNP